MGGPYQTNGNSGMNSNGSYQNGPYQNGPYQNGPYQNQNYNSYQFNNGYPGGPKMQKRIREENEK